MGRAAGGVAGMKFRAGDHLAGMEVVEPNGQLLVLTALGFGKRTPLTEYSSTSRGALGVATIDRKALAKIGKISVARVVQETDELTMISTNGVVLRTEVKKIALQNRATKGVRLMAIAAGDKLASVARVADSDLKQAEI
jgi:DNA gyrase subunit A